MSKIVRCDDCVYCKMIDGNIKCAKTGEDVDFDSGCKKGKRDIDTDDISWGGKRGKQHNYTENNY